MIVSNDRRIGSYRLAHLTLQLFFSSSSHANDVHHAAAAAGKAINLLNLHSSLAITHFLLLRQGVKLPNGQKNTKAQSYQFRLKTMNGFV